MIGSKRFQTRPLFAAGVAVAVVALGALVVGQAQNAPITLVYWTHGAGRPAGAELYMKANPNVKIEIVNQVPEIGRAHV